MQMKLPLVVVMAMGAALLGCKDGGQTQPASGQMPQHPQMGARTGAAGGFSGTVVETMNSGGYTYVKVNTGSQEIWAAAPETHVTVGERVSMPAGAPMQNYHSKTLDRTFEVVYFVSALNVAPKGAGAMAAGAAAGMHDRNHASGDAGVKVGEVKQAAGGHRIADLYVNKATLAGKEVIVRGTVVKYNGGIMGRNWLHIRDGSGGEGTDDITVTTADESGMGATVLVKGKLVADKDFGAGYKYDLLIEDAKITLE